MVGIMSKGLPGDRGPAGQAKDVIGTAGPDQRTVLKVAFPQARMMNSEGANVRVESVRYCAIEDVPEFELPRVLP